MTGAHPLWIDFHCHLDLYPDHEALIRECDRQKIATLAVTTTPKAWPRNRDMAGGSSYVRVALGLHPQLVAERATELPLFEAYLPEARYVGEIGLDAGPRFYRSLGQQEQVFERVLRASAAQGGKILTVHSVRTVAKVLRAIEEHLPPDRGRVVLHWFTGSRSEARRATELGCYFSINGEMLRSPSRRDVVASLPVDRLLTETDGPFVRLHDRTVRPADVKATVQELAEVRGMTVDDMSALLVANLRSLVSA
jgi:TatD DNase family protein